jgi:hypothetical protein
MRILGEPSTFYECRYCVRLYRSRPSDKELFSVGIATIAGSIGYQASERPWSDWRSELLRLNVRPEELDRIHKSLLQRGEGTIKVVRASPFDLQSIGFQPIEADQSPVSRQTTRLKGS